MNKINIRPLHDKVIVERIEERTTASGLVIPENAGDKPQRGIVKATGPGKRREDGTIQEIGVKIGDEVLFGKYAGTEVKVDGKELLVMNEADIIGVIESK